MALVTSRTEIMMKSAQCRTIAAEDHRRLDHPRDRAPKIAEELQQRIGLVLGDLVRPVLR